MIRLVGYVQLVILVSNIPAQFVTLPYMNAATEVFRIPELCGMILDYLDQAEIFYLQNTSQGTRNHLNNYLPWKAAIFHQDAYVGWTVKPVLPDGREGRDDPKKVFWVYTSGPSTGRRVPVTYESHLNTETVQRIGLSAFRQQHARTASQDSMSSTSSSDSASQAGPSTQASTAVPAHQSAQTLGSEGNNQNETLPSASSAAASATGLVATAMTTSSSDSLSELSVGPASIASPTNASQVNPALPPSVSSTAAGPSSSQTNMDWWHDRSPAYSTHRSQMQSVTMNWLLEAKWPKWKYYPISNMLGLEEPVPIAEYFTNSDASYRPLHLMQPPISEVTIMDWKSRMFDVKNAAGVTMGDIMDALLGAE